MSLVGVVFCLGLWLAELLKTKSEIRERVWEVGGWHRGCSLISNKPHRFSLEEGQ